MDKFSQKTRFDEIMEEKSLPYRKKDIYGRQPQTVLPFYDPEWQMLEFDPKDYKYRSIPIEQREFEQSMKPVSVPRKPLDLYFPQLHPENIQYRPLNEMEENRLKHEETQALERRDSPYRDYYHNGDWYKKRREEQYQSEMAGINKYRALNQLPSEEVKKEVLTKYEEFRKVATEFYQRYKEANELASGAVELSYEGSYKDLIRNFEKFVVQSIKIKIGSLFGHERGHHIDKGGGTAKYLAEFFHKGLNIFTINAFNYELKLQEMNNATLLMSSLIEEFDKLKKILIKLPKQLHKEVESFLRTKNNKEFLKWMDENYPDADDKEKFIKKIVNDVYSENGAYASYGGIVNFSLSDLDHIKFYKRIYERVSNTATEGMRQHMHETVSEQLKEQLLEIVSQKISNKINFIISLIPDTDIDDIQYKNIPEQKKRDERDTASMKLAEEVDFKELSRYLKKEFQIDLSSIFNFVETTNKSYRDTEEENIRIYPDAYKNAGSMSLFYGMFLNELRTKLSYTISNMDRVIHSEPFYGAIVKFLKKYSKTIFLHNLRKLSEYDERDVNNLVSSIMRDFIINSLPNFDIANYRHHRNVNFPDFSDLTDIIKETGRFSIADITNYISNKVPSVPKEFWFHLVRNLVKNTDSRTGFKYFESLGTNQTCKIALAAMNAVLKKANKFNPDVFVNTYKKYYYEFMRAAESVNSEFKVSDENKVEIILNAIRNLDTVPQDIENLIKFTQFLHNEASGLTPTDVKKILKNKNFFSFTKSGIARKLIKIYAMIKSRGGGKAIITKYADILDDLIKRNFINKSFLKNMNFIVRFFEGGEEINPKSEIFSKIFVIISSLETDLATLEMGDALQELVSEYQEKDKKLYDLNMYMNDRLRFRVLEGKDPRTLNVGVETNCCQRIGGMAESAARDSFINPYAGVLVLEWKNDEGKWVLVSQSYFHYVPKDNGYILDNVEQNLGSLQSSGVDLEAIYAIFAKKIKEKYPEVSYILAGKGYSKIETDDFKNFKLRSDPRHFSPASTKGSSRSRVYSDFNYRDSINLLAPKRSLISRMKPEEDVKKTAFDMCLRKHIFKSMLAA